MNAQRLFISVNAKVIDRNFYFLQSANVLVALFVVVVVVAFVASVALIVVDGFLLF